MSDLEADYSFECPYCNETLSIAIDITGGKHQTFVYDCEICCQPIVIKMTVDQGAVEDFSAEQENV